MDAAVLYDEISEVCPIISTSVGDPNNRATWSYVPKPQATPEEIAAADNVIATIPAQIKTRILIVDFLARWTNQEYLALEKKRAADIAANKIGNAKNWDIVTFSDYIDLNKKKVETLKADLVTDGVLTQARADEIFS